MATTTKAPLRAKKPTTAIGDAASAKRAMARLERRKDRVTPAEFALAKRGILKAYKKFGIKHEEAKSTRASIRTAGLSIHVHHMSDKDAGDERLCRAVEIAEQSDDGKPTWNQIAKLGQWAGHAAGPFQIGPKEVLEMVANFNATVNRRIPVDFEHASEADPTSGSVPTDGAPAQAWVTQLEDRGSDGLWGLFEWLEPARTYVKEKKYRFLSPAIRFGARDRVTAKNIGARLSSVGITNAPFLDGLAPLVASDHGRSTTMTSGYAYSANEYMPKLRAAMRLGETSTARECFDKLCQLEELFADAGGMVCTFQGVNLEEYLPAMRDTMQVPLSSSYDHVFQAIRELLHAAMGELEETGDDDTEPTSHDMTDGDTDMANEETATKLRDAEAKIITLSAREAELSTKLSAAETSQAQLGLKLKDAESRVTELTATIALKDAEIKAAKDVETKRVEAEAEQRVEEAFSTYKDTKNLSDADRKAMRIVLKSDPETFATLYPRVAPGQQHLLRDLTKDKREPPAKGAPKQRSQKMAQDELHTLSDKYQREGMSLMDAIERANNEIGAAARA